MKKTLSWALLLMFSWSLQANQKAPIEQMLADGNSSEDQYNSNKNSKSGSSRYYGPNDRFVCESRRGQRQHCAADTSGGVRLSQEFSRNRCRGNWGYDYYGVWVRSGCEAEFKVDRYNDYYGNSNDIVRCESYGFRRQTCAVDLQGATVSLIHQLSSRTCNNNWSHNRNEIWVTNGCKADFYVYRNNSNHPGNQPGYQGGEVECRSVGSSVTYCDVPPLSGVEIVRELSTRTNQCRGNWGYASNGLWVRGGCYAIFAVTEYNRSNSPGYPNTGNPGNNPYPPVDQTFTLKCKSRRSKKVYCDTNGPVRDAELKREISAGKYPCRGNWGIDRNGGLFVKNNCYAEFKVYK